METDHINPKAEDGKDEIDNAIPVCFECHAEIHAYNDNHPRGRKFTSEEIKGHKKQWLEICKTSPEAFAEASKYEVGPITSLIDELDFNYHASKDLYGIFLCAFKDEQFNKAIGAGAISILSDEVKEPNIKAYAQIGKANHSIQMYTQNRQGLHGSNAHAKEEIKNANQLIIEAKDKLVSFLRSEE
jgi:HNH endonuclease